MKKTYYKVWSSALDGHSCSLCAKLEGMTVRYDKPFVIAGHSVMAPPLYEGCRCTVLYERNPRPQLRRDYETFLSYAQIANDSDVFGAAVNSYFAALYFLERLADASPGALKVAGLSVENGASLCDQLHNIQSHQDDIFNAAIKRAYDREWYEAQSLINERGRKARMERFLQGVIATQALSPANYEFLRELSK